MRMKSLYFWGAMVFLASGAICAPPGEKHSRKVALLPTEKLPGEGIWVMPARQPVRQEAQTIRVVVWFEDQFLGDGRAYRRRAEAYAGWKRRNLRKAVVATLKDLSDRSYAAAKQSLDSLSTAGVVSHLERHWIVNGFTCDVRSDQLQQLSKVPGVRKIFRGPGRFRGRGPSDPIRSVPKPEGDRAPFSTKQYLHPWYTRGLLADRVWTEFGVTGKGTLNVVHDVNFSLDKPYTYNIYRNPEEIPGNGKDDDGNGLIDDYHGYNFQLNSPRLIITPARGAISPRVLHGSMCASIACGSGRPGVKHELGLAPEGRWAGVIGIRRFEAAIQWAIEHEADTYSMSFSLPGFGEFRSHWRKVMEHGSFCGVCFVSGAGNFARSAKVPVQMRVPEDIPDAVFAAAGVQRDLSRAPSSSKGPVSWNLEHYRDGLVKKPEVCAFNTGLPLLLPDKRALPNVLSGNSYAGPMLCGTIALMLSADPDLLPWDVREILASTALDVADEGVDFETGHGLINCYRAVKEVLRRKAVREDQDPSPYEGRQPGDELDVKAWKNQDEPVFR
ncbi:MAG: S8 family serine peptidase [Phycisphaerae bacterium]|nr:S8 family serine peptidase [Phycisphaerae bacterium]